jgi:hypothetical protein
VRAIVVTALLCASCAKGDIDVHTPGTDYNRHELLKAIDRFTAAGKTPEAYGRLSSEIAALRSGMDETVADEAELQLIVLALDPVRQVKDLTPEERAQKLATTVWSVAMSTPVVAPDPASGPGDPGTPARAGETPDAYMLRLCGGVLSLECEFVVPEAQQQFVEAVAMRRMARRTKHAVEECEPCATDPGWANAVAQWEALEQRTHAAAAAILARVSPERWPVAGRASASWTRAQVLDVADDGEWMLDDQPITPNARGTDLAAARNGATLLDVRIAPGVRADVLASLIDAASAAGFGEVDVEARAELYPWTLRAYRFATGARGVQAPWRAVDTVQVLLRAIDAHAQPGELTHL